MSFKSDKSWLYIVYGYGGIAMQFALLPIFIALVGVEGFGRYTFLVAICNWFAFLATMGTQTKIRELESRRLDTPLPEFQENYRNIFTVFYILTGGSCLALLGFAHFLLAINAAELAVVIVYAYSYALFSILNSMYVGKGELDKAAIYTFIATIFPLGILIIGHHATGYSNIYERFYLACGVHLCLSLYMVRQSRIIAGMLPSFSISKDCFIVNLKLGFNGLYDKIFTEGDKIFIGTLFGDLTLAIYSLGAQVANALRVFSSFLFLRVEKKIFSKSSVPVIPALKAILLSSIAGLFGCYIFEILFPYMFSSSLEPVLYIVYFQVLLVVCRHVSSMYFIESYTRGYSGLYTIVQYLVLLLSMIYLVFFVIELQSFVYTIILTVVLTILVNVFIRGRLPGA
jgi:hypothetical protein